MPEPKQESAVMTDEAVVDKALDQFDASEDTASSRSDEKITDPEVKEESEAAGADQQEKGKAEEEPEQKGKIDPRDEMFRKGYNEAKTKFEAKVKELETKFSPEVLEKIANVEKIISSPAYIRESMRAEGYKDEVINARLRQMGHEVPEAQQSDVDIVLKKLNIDRSKLSSEGQQYIDTYIADAAKVADILIEERMGRILESRLEPIKKTLSVREQETMAQKNYDAMVKAVETDGILDFKKDIEPELMKYIQANPQATQPEVLEYFRDVNHRLCLDRMKTKGKKDTRDEMRSQQRGNMPGIGTKSPDTKLTRGEKESESSFIDRLLDHAGIKA